MAQVEDLYRLIKYVQFRFPSVDAVVSGAILSNYQVGGTPYSPNDLDPKITTDHAHMTNATFLRLAPTTKTPPHV